MKTGCVNLKSCVQSIGYVGKNWVVYLQIWVCKTLPTWLAGWLSHIIVSPELSSVRDYVITHSVRSMYVVCT